MVTQRSNQDCSTVTYFFIVALPTGIAAEVFTLWDILHVSGARNQSALVAGALGV